MSIDLERVRLVIVSHARECLGLQQCCEIDWAAKVLLAEVEKLRTALFQIHTLTDDPVDAHGVLWSVISDCHQRAEEALR